jgi:hypothetical protein
VSYFDTKHDRYDKHDSGCAMSFPLDRITNSLSICLFKLTLSADHTRLEFMSNKRYGRGRV